MSSFTAVRGAMLAVAAVAGVFAGPAPSGAVQGAAEAKITPVLLRAADGVVVHGAFCPAIRPRATILLFHQAGSGKGEYATIAPRLAAAGFDALAVDQRSGGGLFGRNETAAGIGRPASYLEAERDLEAAFAWGRARGRPVILWGSSYSAALVFRVVARHSGQVAAVLAFSPGEYLGGPDLVHAAARRVSAPVYVTSAADPGEITAARSILAASPARVKVQFVPTAGVHGAATLIPARDPTGAAANWRAVLAFLRPVG